MAGIFEIKTFYEHINKPLEINKAGIGHFNVFRIKDMLLPKHSKATYVKRSFFKVTLITGQSKLHFADKCIAVNGTALVFTNPTIPYYWERIGENHNGYMCIFTESFFNLFGNIRDYPVFQFNDAAVIPLDDPQIPKYVSMFEKMLEELQGIYIYKYDLLRNHLMELIHEAQKLQPVADQYVGSNAAERITTLFGELLERQFPIELNYQVLSIRTPASFARHLNIHVNHLNKALKQITGQSTSQLINNRVIQEAKMLLKNTSWTVAEIAFSLGFEEPNHFSTFFKNKTETTPNKYRQL